jgi:hypothetical protein
MVVATSCQLVSFSVGRAEKLTSWQLVATTATTDLRESAGELPDGRVDSQHLKEVPP